MVLALGPEAACCLPVLLQPGLGFCFFLSGGHFCKLQLPTSAARRLVVRRERACGVQRRQRWLRPPRCSSRMRYTGDGGWRLLASADARDLCALPCTPAFLGLCSAARSAAVAKVVERLRFLCSPRRRPPCAACGGGGGSGGLQIHVHPRRASCCFLLLRHFCSRAGAGRGGRSRSSH